MIFSNAKRPLLIFGWGIHLAGYEKEAVELCHHLRVPAVCTWGAADLFRWDDPLYVGTFGTHGTRPANWALQNADEVLTIGTRLDTKATGSPASDFAKKAKTVYMVDIDSAEIDKFYRLGREITGIYSDAKEFIEKYPIASFNSRRDLWPNLSDWMIKIEKWKQKYPGYDPEYKIGEGINPYQFIDELSSKLRQEDVIVSDTGCPVGWMMQAFKFTGQRFYHAWNNTPMGYGLPAAIGAASASPGRIILVTGDGGLSVNITELATLYRHQFNIKIILFNNRGHAMCRQTQRTWLGGEYPSTSYEGGLATPNFEAIAQAYDIPTYADVDTLLASDGPGFLNLDIDLDYQIVPQVKAGKPLEDADPPIPREELAEIMK